MGPAAHHLRDAVLPGLGRSQRQVHPAGSPGPRGSVSDCLHLADAVVHLFCTHSPRGSSTERAPLRGTRDSAARPAYCTRNAADRTRSPGLGLLPPHELCPHPPSRIGQAGRDVCDHHSAGSRRSRFLVTCHRQHRRCRRRGGCRRSRLAVQAAAPIRASCGQGIHELLLARVGELIRHSRHLSRAGRHRVPHDWHGGHWGHHAHGADHAIHPPCGPGGDACAVSGDLRG